MLTHITWAQEVSGGLVVLNLALPCQWLRHDTRPEYQDPVRHTAQKKREKERKKKTIIIYF